MRTRGRVRDLAGVYTKSFAGPAIKLDWDLAGEYHL